MNKRSAGNINRMFIQNYLVEMHRSTSQGPELAAQSADSEPVCFDVTLMATDNVFMSCQMWLAQPE